MKPVLKVNELTKKYKNDCGIIDISFEVEQGDIFGLIGPNGSGKTTIMKIITGLLQADKGSVQILGNNILKESLKEVGCLIEAPAIYEYLTARENLKLASNYYDEIKKPRIDDILTQTGLIEHADKKVRKYTPEMKQRLGIALAFISKPKLIILDEHNNELDRNGIEKIKEMILKHSRLGATFLISSHRPHEIESMCNKVGIIKEGRILEVVSMRNALEECENFKKYYLMQVEGREIYEADKSWNN
ncbi:ATP-binding cassette domain-containing protein [Clostridium saccharoperbutylacetonicum]|uniref:ATP-binding cassette domain-containing protein n=1 Tax=Clostridium saccharoperbutylacetonicum TaxID=36745 RepID=UPI0039EADB9F